MKRKKIFILLICGLHLLPLALTGDEIKTSIMTIGTLETDGSKNTSHSPSEYKTNNAGAKGGDNGGGIPTGVLNALDASDISFLPNNADESGIEIEIGSGNSGSFQLGLNGEEISTKNFLGGLSYASNFAVFSEHIKALANLLPDAGSSIDAIDRYAYIEGIMNSSTVTHQIDRFSGQLAIGSQPNPDFGIMCLDPTLSTQVVVSCLEKKHINKDDALNLMKAAAEGIIERVRTMSCPVCMVLFNDNAVADAPVFEQSNNPTFSTATQSAAKVFIEAFNSAVKNHLTSLPEDTSVIEVDKSAVKLSSTSSPAAQEKALQKIDPKDTPLFEVGKTVKDLNKLRDKHDQMTNVPLYRSGSTASTYQADASQSKSAFINLNTRSSKHNQEIGEKIAHLISEENAVRVVDEERKRGRRRRR